MINQTSLNVIRQPQSSQKSILHYSKLKKLQPHPHVFVSKQQRFTDRIHRDNSPGPGAYIDPLAKSKSNQKSFQQNKNKQSRSNHLDGFVAKQHQWIFGSNRANFVKNQIQLGPGEYDLDKKEIKKIANSWSKAQRFNGTEWGGSDTQLGPGSYQANVTPEEKVKRKQMGIFKSKSPKSFLQALQKKVSKNLLNPQLQLKNQFESKRQQLQQYQKLAKSQTKIKKQVKLDPVFQSKSKRYQIKNPQNSKVIGPGYYNLNIQQVQNIKKRRVSSIVNTTHHVNRQKNIQSQTLINPNPGPTSYHLQKYSIQNQLNRKISSIKGSMSLETRFKSSDIKKQISDSMPGPGHYGRQKYVFIDQRQYEHKPLVSHHQKVVVPFLSSSPREGLEKDSGNTFIGNYNLNQFDLSEKIKKKRNHLQKLKAMDISVPGFESSERRTTFNLSKILKEKNFKLQSMTKMPII